MTETSTSTTSLASNTPHSRDRIPQILGDLRARQRRVNAVRFACYGLVTGAVVGCVAGATARLAGGASPINSAALSLACAGAAALVGLAVGFRWRVDDLSLARALDSVAGSQDRFASAVQLAGHRHQERAAMIADDAAERVAGTPAARVLPVRVPRALRWAPAPLLLLAIVLLTAPSGQAQAGQARTPEITADNWKEIEKEFKKDLAKMQRPQTAEEQDLRKELENLASMLAKAPDKREALAEIARLSDKVAQQRKALGAKGTSMKEAAKAMNASKLLQKFASQLKQGAYDQAGDELKKLADKLEQKEETPDAEEMEAMAADLKKLSEAMKNDQEMQQECQKCSGSAGKMNPKELADALKKLSEQMKKKSQCQSQCDNAGDAEDLLEQLKRMMNQCNGQCNGEGEGEQPGFGNGNKPGAKKGGTKAGWGTAAKWDGGSLKPGEHKTTTEVANAMERQGTSTTFHTVSPDEKATSGRAFKDLYAEFAQKSEADLDLESVPAAYRDYLKRYFKSIRPAEPGDKEKEPAPAQP